MADKVKTKQGPFKVGGEASAKIASNIMEIMSWEKPDRKDIEGLYAAFGRYVQFCIDRQMQIGNLNAYMAMGINKNIAHDWEIGRYGTPEHKILIGQVKAVCASFREMAMAEGEVNPVTGIWWQKNFDGLKDVQEVVVQANTRIEQYNADDIRAKYQLAAEDRLALEGPKNDVGGI